MEIIQIKGRDVNSIKLWEKLGKPADDDIIEVIRKTDIESNQVDKPVKPEIAKIDYDNLQYKYSNVCANCISLGKHYGDNICNSPKFSLWNLTNIDVEIEEWGCTFFEQREA